MARIWRLTTHHKYQLDALDWYRSERFIALNWGWTGDLRTDEPAASEQAIQKLIGPTDDHHAARCLWEFWRVMETNDLVILRLSDEYSNDCVVRVGDYYWDRTYPPKINHYPDCDEYEWQGHLYKRNWEYFHRRRMAFVGNMNDARQLWESTAIAPGYSVYMALNQRVYK